MSFYRLEGRMDLLPGTIWGGNDETIYLPECPEPESDAEPLFWIVDKRGKRTPLAWAGGFALDDDAFSKVRDCASLTEGRPVLTHIPFHPHRLPPSARALMRSIMATARYFRSKNMFPRWPIEPSLAVLDAIDRIARPDTQTRFWPNQADFAMALSHDVDTAIGQKNVLPLAEIEEDSGLRSTWFLTPGNYDVDEVLWREMAERGHEIACHGLFHDFKLGYLTPAQIGVRLDKALQLMASFDVRGFRAPGFLRTRPLLDAVTPRFLYDSSIPDTLTLHGSSGCASVFPYMLGSLAEIPVTLPYDGEMMALGMGLEAREEIWKRKAKWVKEVGGLIHILTHPDQEFTSNGEERELYRRTLGDLKSEQERTWFPLLKDIAAFLNGDVVSSQDYEKD